MSAEDYRCRHCNHLVLYRSDHHPDCRHHPSQEPDPATWN